MKKIRLILFLAACSITCFSCKKSGGSGNTQTNLQAELQGTWTIVDHIAINVTGLPNDTTIPLHTETFIFTGDSLASDTWYTGSYNSAGNPPTYTVTQATEFKSSVKFSAGTDYIIGYYQSITDTMHINSISNNQLVLQENFPNFDLITELVK